MPLVHPRITETPRRFYPAPVPIVPLSPPLDLIVSSSSGAYSVRKLRAAYAGSAIRVRRSSDNTEQDIGFTASGGLDTSSLTSFVGANNGFIKTWYDQSGNSRDYTQSTTANQPFIVNAGTLQTKNGKPCIGFDGANYRLDGNTAAKAMTNGVAGFTTLTIFAPSAASANVVYYYHSVNSTATGSRYSIGCSNANRLRSSMRRASTDTGNVTTSAADNAYTSGTLISNTGKITYPTSPLFTSYLNGVSHYTGSSGLTAGSTTDANDANATSIGSAASLALFSGFISEIITYQSALNDSDRQAIERNQGTYFGVLVS